MVRNKGLVGSFKISKNNEFKKERILDSKDLIGIKETDAISGCCSIYRSNSLELSGYGDESFLDLKILNYPAIKKLWKTHV